MSASSRSIPSAKLVAVCDHRAGRAQAALERTICTASRFTTTWRRCSRGSRTSTSIHLATPSGTHLETAHGGDEGGKHVICEKPLEIQLDRVDQMIETADEAWREARVHFPGTAGRTRTARSNRAAEEGRFGTLSWAGCFTPWYRPDKYYSRTAAGAGTWELDGGGAVMNQCIHAIDLLQWIAGPVESVAAFGGRAFIRRSRPKTP